MLVGPEKYQSSLALMKVDALECQKKTLHVELNILPIELPQLPIGQLVL